MKCGAGHVVVDQIFDHEPAGDSEHSQKQVKRACREVDVFAQSGLAVDILIPSLPVE
jgi:hypothetical protein